MQTTNAVLLVRPANFARASETVGDNSFQEAVAAEPFDAINARALREFDRFVELLQQAGVAVTVVDDTPRPVKPDAVFPNNWFSTHPDGTLVVYPTYWPQRRLERRQEIIDRLAERHTVRNRLDLTDWETQDWFLESTGCLLLDRVNRIAYACLSQRCTAEAVHAWCERMDYRPITFRAFDARGNAVYHTNVMMALGTRHAVVCLPAISDQGERARVRESLLLTGYTLVELTLKQIDRFAGNLLEVRTPEGPLWVMSTAAHRALSAKQRTTLLSVPDMRILHTDLSTIERYGGGSARCMLGEVFLPLRELA